MDGWMDEAGTKWRTLNACQLVLSGIDPIFLSYCYLTSPKGSNQQQNAWNCNPKLYEYNGPDHVQRLQKLYIHVLSRFWRSFNWKNPQVSQDFGRTKFENHRTVPSEVWSANAARRFSISGEITIGSHVRTQYWFLSWLFPVIWIDILWSRLQPPSVCNLARWDKSRRFECLRPDSPQNPAGPISKSQSGSRLETVLLISPYSTFRISSQLTFKSGLLPCEMLWVREFFKHSGGYQVFSLVLGAVNSWTYLADLDHWMTMIQNTPLLHLVIATNTIKNQHLHHSSSFPEISSTRILTHTSTVFQPLCT